MFSKRYRGLTLFIGGIFFNLIESLYFGRFTTIGFNIFPKSIGEFVCDDISMVLSIIGIFLIIDYFVKEIKKLNQI
jgi:hypothetical protein